MIKTQRD